MKDYQARAMKKYHDAHIVRWSLSLNDRTDPDIIRFIEGCPSKNGYIKALIRADIARGEDSILARIRKNKTEAED